MPAILPIRKGPAPGTRFPFTTKRLTDYQCPAGVDRIELRDAKGNGLRCRVTASGVKTFNILRRVNGKLARVQIGRFPNVSLDTARKQAAKLLNQIAQGGDPRAERRQARSSLTFGELADDFLDNAIRPGSRTRKEYRRQIDRYLAPWKKKPLSEIDRHQVSLLHGKIGKKKPFQANRLLATISALFNFARHRRNWRGENPATGIQRFPEASRERFLTAAEMPKFIEAVHAEPNETIRDLVLLLLLTGARRGALQAMKWADVDLDASTWTIPASDSKNGRAIHLPLSPDAVAIIRNRERTSEYVFPGRSSGHLQEPKKAWSNILKRAGIKNLRIHDLRRTFGSFQAAAGVSLQIIGRTLGHQSIQATQVYSRLDLQPIRKAVDNASTAILNAAKGANNGKA